ncbi:MAG TPA: bifunctional phosphoribosylaminoimidazolecarboxamide formyltransferase/IMP cyclohydrolase [Syntrophales bacterium]|nr:bifunctional phosphoribosylaminoimidazolecarboxamide formyltransferase/IMP cyclohydrolase [Syntrophales bacterium]HON22274.1 bifunctional phosphoribosylaminoimidazolecarboxamide formyltransferase/IMP cyclohydrolase [Syntrophales bacterium]HOU77970.1 bifunctional phosphoribosylaminoimidazolecarboxamide formyltransferase/IMP cyclohydrolase [Syntrophales bacterium]HQG34168.1 bifunctional phosphoribosylaminoimidazolecarboxamide formyltransferase/IMP cyclohydrolase [Syntrophales bacterium]HQI3617
MHMNVIKRALISVTDKAGIVEFARELNALGVEILSTGGTAAQLRNSGLPVRDVSDYTGFPEMMDGRLKTLHPKIHGGLLALRDNPRHLEALQAHDISLIDMAVINLYRFEDTVAKPGCTLEEAVENIDIGGPTMLRAAAKNYRFVSVVTDPADYERVIEEMKRTGGKISEATNFYLATKTFQLTARYDAAISNYLGRIEPDGKQSDFPKTFTFQVTRAQDLRYGENPHQKAAFYRENKPFLSAVANARQLHGKELSYNNIMDSDAAWQMVSDFKLPAAVVIKHANPCGAATSDGELLTAYEKALQTDPVSAFGGIVALNRPVDGKTAAELSKTFLEVIIAPAFTDEARQILGAKKNVRLLEVPAAPADAPPDYDFRRVVGGLLIQERDTDDFDIRRARVVTKRSPTEAEYQALDFAWRVVKHVKSNAIVLATRDQLVGVGAGQMSRVDSVRIARMKAILPTAGTVLASDAFFPFRDGIDMAAEAGVTAIIQPGGSVRDEEAIQAADEHGMAMIFTGKRHFKH